jgi:hypothetical protein
MRLLTIHPVVITVLASIALLSALSSEYVIRAVPIFAGNFGIGHGTCTMLLPPREYSSNHKYSRWTFDQDRATNRLRAIAEPIAERRSDVMFVDIRLTSKGPSISPPQFAAHLSLALFDKRKDDFQTAVSDTDAERARSQARLDFVSTRPDLRITHEAFIFEPLGMVQWYSLQGDVVYRTPADRTFVFVCRRRLSSGGFASISSSGLGVFGGVEDNDAQICLVR